MPPRPFCVSGQSAAALRGPRPTPEGLAGVAGGGGGNRLGAVLPRAAPASVAAAFAACPVARARGASALTTAVSAIGLRRQRREHHRHVPAVEVRALLDRAELDHVLGEPQQELLAALGVSRLAAAEHDRHLDLVLVTEEALDVTLLRLVVVGRDLRPQLDLAHGHRLLVAARRLGLLLLLVLVLRVVEHAAHW